MTRPRKLAAIRAAGEAGDEAAFVRLVLLSDLPAHVALSAWEDGVAWARIARAVDAMDALEEVGA